MRNKKNFDLKILKYNGYKDSVFFFVVGWVMNTTKRRE